jgi:hypothetical protein
MEKVFGKDPRYVFALQRGAGAESFVLTSFGQPNPQDDEFLQDSVALYGGVLWSVDTKRLVELETDPQFTLDSMRREGTGENLVRMDARLSEVKFKGRPNELRRTSVMTVYLDPARFWAVRSYESKINVSMPKNSYSDLAKGTVEYQGAGGAFPPVPIRHKIVLCNPDGTERVTNLTEFSEWKYRDRIQDDELGLAAFGLPEPPEYRQEKRTPNYVWILAVAGICGILGIGFRYLARKRRPFPVAG